MLERDPVRLMIIDTSPANSGGAHLLHTYCSHFDPQRIRALMVLHEDNVWAARYRENETADVLVEDGMFQSNTVPAIHETSAGAWLHEVAGRIAHLTPAFYRLVQEIRRRRIDVVMGLCDTPAMGAALLGTVTGRPAIMHLVSTYVNEVEPAGLTALGLLPAVRRVVQLSRYSARQFPLLQRKTVVIHTGVDVDAVQRPRTLSLRGPRGFSPDVPLVGIAGRFVDVKGMDVFVRAAAVIAAKAPDARFFLLGDDRGRYGDEVHRLVRELGLSDRVTFTGFVGDVYAALADLDVVVVPSRRECAPVVIYESMALGKPVVASNVHGIPELVEAGRTGLLVPVEDHAAVAEAVLALLADRVGRREMGERARRRVRERFDSRQAVRRLEDVVVEVAAERAWPWSRAGQSPSRTNP